MYIIKHRLYELESILDKKLFVRISNSEIVNFNDVKNIDDVNLRLVALKKDYKKSIKKLSNSKTPYSKISKELEEFTNLLKAWIAEFGSAWSSSNINSIFLPFIPPDELTSSCIKSTAFLTDCP